MTQFIAFLGALPQLLTMVNQVVAWVNKISGNDPAGFAVKVGGVFAQLNAAQTETERSTSAKALADLLSGL